MSTFNGIVKEYPLISIDNFLEETKNFQSTVFFLSHCHSDHMNGLRDKKFFKLLESRGFRRIYMSDVSEHLLKNDDIFTHLSKYLERMWIKPYPLPKKVQPEWMATKFITLTIVLDRSSVLLWSFIIFKPFSMYLFISTLYMFEERLKSPISLPIEQPTIVDVYDENGVICSRVVVTLLTAGHCPGSVMFLIEGDNGRVLYTGDFRLPVGGTARLPNLHDETGRLKPLCSLYIDTTFCSEKCMYIPSREQCLVEILKLVEEWLANGPDHIVRFICPAQYNYEFVFVEIFKKLGEKTHVFENKLKKYKGIKIIEDAVTSVATEARVHACISGFSMDFKEILYIYESPCGYHTEDFKPIKVRLIKPSAMFFQRNKYSDLSVVDAGSNVHRVCFSTHSSLDEIRDMVKYLNPKRVYPNVVRGTTVEQILHLIGAPYWNYSDSLSPLGCLRNDFNQSESMSISNSLPFYDDCYKITHQSQTLIASSANQEDVPEANEEESKSTFQHIGKHKAPLHDIEVSTPLSTNSVPLSNVPSNDNTADLVKSNCDNTSPVKWECPILSSDDENYDPNCSFDSSKDKSDSDVCATSEEQNLDELVKECLSPAKPNLPKSVPLENNISVEKQKCFSMGDSSASKLEPPVFHINDLPKKHASFSSVSSITSNTELHVKESGIRYELEKLLASQELSAVFTTDSDKRAPDLELVSMSSRAASCIDAPNQCSVDDSKINFDSRDQISRRNTSNMTEKLVKDSPSYEKKNCSKQVSSDKLETTSAIQSQYTIHILGQNVSTNFTKVENQSSTIQMAENSSWRQSKLMLDINKLNFHASDLKDMVSQNSALGVEVTDTEFDVLRKHDLSNFSNPSYVIQPGKSSIKELSKKNYLKKSSVPLDVHIFDNSKTLSNHNTVKGPQASNCIAQNFVRGNKTNKANRKRMSSTTKHRLIAQESQTFSAAGTSNDMTLIKQFPQCLPYFSKKLQDPFASKYEKSLIKSQKKEPAAGNSQFNQDDVSILSCRNKCDKVVPVIDLSPDEYDSEVELFNCAELDLEKTLPIESNKAVQSENKDAFTAEEAAIAEDSPSLLDTKHRSDVLVTASCKRLNSGIKRKSTDKDSFIAKKSPNVHFSSDCDIDADVESSPDDLLPLTLSPVSTYFNEILGSKTK